MQRRQFLRYGALAAGAAILPLGRSAWAARLPTAGPRLITVFLRGAVDGLNVAIPYSDEAYYSYRPTIAVPRPGEEGGVIDLDGRFGMHPALAGLQPLWQQKQLAFIHACGSPDPDRSHFEAQAYMETATPGKPGTTTGWMNRLAGAMKLHTEETVSFSSTAPLIVRGPTAVSTFPTGRAATRVQPMDRDPVRQAFDPLYRDDPHLGSIWREAERSRDKLLSDLQKDMRDSAQGAPDARGFADDTQRAARMMSADPGLRLVFFQLGGWDTHVNQGAAKGQLASHLQGLADGLVALQSGLGSAWQDTVVLVMSEFGRTVRENGNRGTDHGHGNVHWLLGGAIGGGRVYGDWKGLDEAALHQNRDLPVTTDFRSVIALVMTHHLRLPTPTVASVLPHFTPDFHAIENLLPIKAPAPTA